jgi:hypothetical protein
MAKALREPLLKVFPPALLGRLVVIPYYPLSDEMMGASCPPAARPHQEARGAGRTASRSPTTTTWSS